MPNSDVGDTLLVVNDLEKTRKFLEDIVGITNLGAGAPNQTTFQLSNNKKIYVFQDTVITLSIAKHSIEIRIDDFDNVVDRLQQIYQGRNTLVDSMEADGISLSFAEGGNQVSVITMDTGTSRVRITRL